MAARPVAQLPNISTDNADPTSPSANSPTETSSSSGTKRKRDDKEPKIYAVKKGIKPGIYAKWSDCLAQVKGFKGAVFQSFPSIEEAEEYMAGKRSVASTRSLPGAPQKFYAVASGRRPGIYTDWPSAQEQVVGWKQPKYKKFSTLAEAQAFVQQGSRVVNAADKDGPEDRGKPDAKRKTGAAPIPGFLDEDFSKDAEGNLFEPGTGPLPLGAEDGFDPNILLDPSTGEVVYKTSEQKKATKMMKTSSTGKLKIYTDGSSIRNGQSGARAGVGVYFGDGDSRNVSEALKGSRQTNQRAELTAVQRALDLAPRHRDVTIYTDSRYAIDCLTNWSIGWRKNGWVTTGKKPVENKDLIEAALAKIEERDVLKVKTLFEWVKGHGTDPGNIAADKLAVAGAVRGA